MGAVKISSKFERLPLLKGFKQSSFVKNVAILASGTALAQAIPVFASPVLTRLYTPQDFGLLAVLMAIVSSLAPAVCGKYEVAMVLPRSNTKGLELLGITFWISFAFSVALFVFLALFPGPILSVLGAQDLNGWIYLSPLLLFLTGLMTTMNYFANRQQDYSKMATSKLTRAFAVAVVSITLGITGLGALGLFVGVASGLLLAVAYLLYSYRGQFPHGFLRWNRSRTAMLVKYNGYPLYNASSALLNGVTIAMPVFFLTHYFTGDVVGYFALVTRVANAPLTFISFSFSQVNLRKIGEMVNGGHTEYICSYLLKLTGGLFVMVLVPALVFILYAPEIFTALFGSEWKMAGIYMQILLPALILRFIVVSISSTFGALGRNGFAFTKRMLAFSGSIVVYGFVGKYVTTPLHFMVIISLLIAITELVGIVLVIAAAKTGKA